MATLEKAPTSNFWSTSLNGAINDSVTTITLNSTVGLQAPGRLVINRQDSTGKNTPSAREVISFTGISGSDLTGVTRGADNSTARSHADGSLVESAIVVGNWDALYKVIDQEHSTSGVHSVADMITGGSVIDDDTFATASATKLATSESIKAYVDNSPDSIYRQAIINGNFDVWQRGTSLVWSTGGPLLADRWAFYSTADGGTLPTITWSRQAVTPGELDGSFFFNRINVNGAGSSLGNSSIAQLLEKIEYGTRYLCGNGKKVTVSFWAKSDIADKKLGVSLYQDYGTTGSPSTQEIITGEAFTLTSSWAKYTHTFTTNTLSGKTFGTSLNDWLGLQFSYMWGSTKGTALGLGSAEDFGGSGNIDIAQVQLCAGDVALPFMPKSFEEELRACMRYYEKSYNIDVNPGTNTAVGAVDLYTSDVSNAAYTIKTYVSFSVKKRATPTVKSYSPAGTIDRVSMLGGEKTSTIVAGMSGFSIQATDSTNTGRAISFNWTAEAEL